MVCNGSCLATPIGAGIAQDRQQQLVAALFGEINNGNLQFICVGLPVIYCPSDKESHWVQSVLLLFIVL